MRISNSNPYGNQHQQGSTSRAELFKRKFKAGQVLKGKLLRMEQGSLAWVLIGGMELLAQIETTPKQGQWLEFLVLTLEPSIILRQIQNGHDPRSTVFLRDYLRSYLTERDKLDTTLHATLWNSLNSEATDSLEASHNALITHLAANETTLDQFTRVMRLLTNVQHMVAASGHGAFFYMPWLAPCAKGVELLISPKNKSQTLTIGAVFPPSNHVVLAGQMGSNDTSQNFAYRLLLEKNCKASNNSLRTGNTTHMTSCLGTQPMPSDAHDILSMIFKENPQQRRGLNIQA